MDMIIQEYKIYHFELVIVENNHFQQSMIDFLQAQSIAIPVEGQTTGTNKIDLNSGVPALIPTFMFNQWEIPIDNHHFLSECQCEICNWLEELTTFPHGKRLDSVMACWLAWKAVHRDDYGGVEMDGESMIYGVPDIMEHINKQRGLGLLPQGIGRGGIVIDTF